MDWPPAFRIAGLSAGINALNVKCDTPTVSHIAIAVLNAYHIAKLRHSGRIANDNATHVECDNAGGDMTGA